MNNKPLSIIVPTYNMEKYLDKCLTSLIVGEADSEFMQKLEVIVVNDGSTDSSSKIAHRYEASFPNTFKVIDKENGNYGSCINAALPLVSGRYVKVLDADDWFDTDAFTTFISWLKNKDSDAIISDFEIVDKAGNNKNTISFSNLSTTREFSLSDMSVYYRQILMHATTYKTKLLHDINYHQSEGISYSDQEWIFLPMSQALRLSYYPKSLYKYFVGRDGQTVNKQVWEKNFWMEIQGTICMLKTYANKNDETGNEYLRERLITRISTIYYAYIITFPTLQNEEIVRQFDNELRSLYPEFYNVSNVFSCIILRMHFPYVRLWRMGISKKIIRSITAVRRKSPFS